MIRSLIDNDLYKFSMQQFVMHRFANTMIRAKFKNRGDEDLTPFTKEIAEAIREYCQLKFRKEEIDFMREKIPYFTSDYFEFLRVFRTNPDFIKVYESEGKLEILIEGPWLYTILLEVPILTIVSEIHTRFRAGSAAVLEDHYAIGRERLQEKIRSIREHQFYLEEQHVVTRAQGAPHVFNFADFGTRRRASYNWQKEVLATLVKNVPQNLVGTSNLHFAKEFDLTPIGTMAHEIFQAGQALGPRVEDSQRFILEQWVQEFRGDLGIALSDIFGFDVFLKDFDKFLAKLYDGARQDSGDPFEWGEKLIRHYSNFKIDSRTKYGVWSDGLNFFKAFKIDLQFYKRLKTSFGLGTDLTNDIGLAALRIVLKLIECNGQPVAKVSDSVGKGMCPSASYEEYVKQVIRNKLRGSWE